MSARKKTPAPARKKAAGKTGERARATEALGAVRHPILNADTIDMLVREAKDVRERAYAPYSRYMVGAAILTSSGSVFVGCNVENASLGGTICAERGAVMQMVAAGEREPIACAVVTGDEEPASPCGICRQVLAEFSSDLPVILVGVGKRGTVDGRVGHIVSLAELLPLQFRLKS